MSLVTFDDTIATAGLGCLLVVPEFEAPAARIWREDWASDLAGCAGGLGLAVRILTALWAMTAGTSKMRAMAIDKPLDQTKFLVRSEEAQSSALQKPMKRVVTFIVVMANAAKALKTGNALEAISSVAQSLKGIAELFGDQNIEYLLSIVISEVETLWTKFDELDQKHREFLDTDWPALLVDGQRRARVVRAKERVRRIAIILSNAAKSEPSPAPDEIEEMMRIAMDLGDRDVLALRLIADSAAGNLWPDRLSLYHAWDLWKRIPWSANGFIDSDVESVCSKLASFGLLARLDLPSNQNVLTNMHNGYELLQKGKAFLRFVSSQAKSA